MQLAGLRSWAACRNSGPTRRLPVVCSARTPNSVATNFAQSAAAALTAIVLLMPSGAEARLEGVNRPDLLPTEFSTVIDVAGFLAPSEEKRLTAEIAALETDTGFKLRVLAQSYPETPGLAIKQFWGVDDNTIVFVADPTFGDLVNVNVGIGLDLEVPRSFWSRLAGRYGTKFYVKEKGEAEAIMNTVSAIDACLREESGKFKCSKVQGELGEAASSGNYGKFFGQ